MSHGSIADMFLPQHGPKPKFSETEQEQIEAFEKRSRELPVDERELVVDNAWLFCTCRPAWIRVTVETPPSHAVCIVHHGYMITWDGRVL